MKVCTSCSESLTEDYFHKNRGSCKSCTSSNSMKTSRKVNGLVKGMYRSQLHRSIVRGHPPPEYSKNIFMIWLFSQTSFREIYDEWTKGGYQKGRVPSVDRIDSSVHYKLSNISLVTWGDNSRNWDIEGANNNTKSFVKEPSSNAICQMTLDWECIDVFPSMVEASRLTGISYMKISRCFRSLTKNPTDYRWSYVGSPVYDE